jgi:hypothetical protein
LQVSFLDLAVCRTLLRNSEPFTYPISYTFVRSPVIFALLRLCRPAGVRRPRPQCMARHPTGDQAWAGISGLWRCVSFRFRPSPSANSSRSRCLAEQAVRGESPLLFLDQCAGYQGKRGQPHFLRRQVREVAGEVVEAGGVEPPSEKARNEENYVRIRLMIFDRHL